MISHKYFCDSAAIGILEKNTNNIVWKGLSREILFRSTYSKKVATISAKKKIEYWRKQYPSMYINIANYCSKADNGMVFEGFESSQLNRSQNVEGWAEYLEFNNIYDFRHWSTTAPAWWRSLCNSSALAQYHKSHRWHSLCELSYPLPAHSNRNSKLQSLKYFRGSTAAQNSPSLETDGIFFSTTTSTKYLLPRNTEELILDVSGRTKCVHNRLVHIELVGAQACQAARQAVRHAWTNLGSLGSLDHLSSLGNRGRP